MTCLSKKVTTFNVKKPFSVAGKNINTVIVGSQEKDKKTGTSDGEVLEGMKVANAIYSTLYLQKQMQGV